MTRELLLGNEAIVLGLVEQGCRCRDTFGLSDREAMTFLCRMGGVLGGFMVGLRDGAVEARETACLAQGAAACRFEVGGEL